jgi:hypothetical protein
MGFRLRQQAVVQAFANLLARPDFAGVLPDLIAVKERVGIFNSACAA